MASTALSAFSLQHFVIRWIACLFLVFGTYNPFHRSYWHWVVESEGDVILKALIGIALVIIYVFLLWVVIASLGGWGIFAGAVVAGLSAVEILDLLPGGAESRFVSSMVYIFCLASFFAVGLSWPNVVSRLSGQIQKRYLVKGKRLK
jgi:hypothetical protein